MALSLGIADSSRERAGVESAMRSTNDNNYNYNEKLQQ